MACSRRFELLTDAVATFEGRSGNTAPLGELELLKLRYIHPGGKNGMLIEL
jgi:hypothetical protein